MYPILCNIWGGGTSPRIGSSAAAFRWIWRQFEGKKDQTPMDLCADFGEAYVAGSGRFRGNVG